MKLIRYRVFIKYCVFSSNFCDFSELCQFRCSAGVLPAWCVYTHCHRGKTEKAQSPEYFKILGKNTIFNEYPVSAMAYDRAIVQYMCAVLARKIGFSCSQKYHFRRLCEHNVLALKANLMPFKFV